jgi:peptidoglycan-N-acetylglucosamine deacetylase
MVGGLGEAGFRSSGRGRSVRRGGERRRSLRAVLTALALGSAALPSAGRAEAVALTFDDLPTLSLTPSVTYDQTTSQDLLSGLKAHRFPAIGFVNEGKLEGDGRAARTALLKAWVDAGQDLGNHSYSHLSLNDTPVDAYIADVARGEPVTRSLLAAHGRSLRWYRYPYLETGLTLPARRRFEGWLRAHGYRVAPVTMENSDWMFAYPYDEAVLHGDQAEVLRIRQAYLDYTARVVPWYRMAALELLGRRPSFVFLLHASRLNADSLNGLAEILKANQLRPTTLGTAMQDKAYAIADNYAGPDGDEWLSRWSLTLKRPLPWGSFPEPPADIAAAEQRLDTSP